MKKRRREFSLKWGVLTTVLLCWVLPIVTTVLIAALLLSNTYTENLRQTVENGVRHAFEQVEMQMASALEASKSVSYDGIVRSAYQEYEETGDRNTLYSQVTDYLARSYTRDDKFLAVFISFLDCPDQAYAYVSPQVSGNYGAQQRYGQVVKEKAMDLLADTDAGIYFMEVEDQLYMVRNLLDPKFQPYAVLVMLCDKDVIFRPLWAIAESSQVQISIDELEVALPVEPELLHRGRQQVVRTSCASEVSGHKLSLSAAATGLDIFEAMPELLYAILIVVLLAIPLLALVIVSFYRQVTHPLEVLADAYDRVQGGDRGCQIREFPQNVEFRQLTEHFNAMSTELESQFNRLYAEQQALQQARIKALQSQINPHFLGNTLEIINWEARIAGNEKVYTMIEALSTMMDAAIGRDGRAQIALREELTYVDAYLYIIQQRLGPRMTVTKEIDGELLDVEIPRLLLQPLVENAVDHDITKRRTSELLLRAYARKGLVYLEVEHDGEITREDREKIESLLSAPVGPVLSGRVGIRNVNQRLNLLYGEKGSLRIFELRPGRILARVVLPQTEEERKKEQETAMEALMKQRKNAYNRRKGGGKYEKNHRFSPRPASDPVRLRSAASGSTGGPCDAECSHLLRWG